MSDKKPWEEEWGYDPNDASEEFIIRSAERREVASPSHDTTDTDLRFISAAPDMARAILTEFGSFGGDDDGEWHTNECWGHQQGSARVPCARRCRATRAALQKAGVLP
jgi:hypothetical protein